jgi:hypothetical protein
MDEVMNDYIKDYWKNKPQRNYYYDEVKDECVSEDSLDANESETVESSKASNVS